MSNLIIVSTLLYLRRKQEGVYTSYMFGPVGRQIKVQKRMPSHTSLVLLDVQFNCDFPRDELISLLAIFL